MSASRFGTRHPAALSLLALSLVSSGVMSGQAGAQESAPAVTQAPPQTTSAKPKVKAAPSADGSGSSAAAAATPQASGDQALKKRVEQLEEQLVDLQVVIGTLESLARSGVRPPPAAPVSTGGMSGSDHSRLETLETQIRALSAQVEQLSQGRRTDLRPPAGGAGTATGSVAANGAAGTAGGDTGVKIGQWSPPPAGAGQDAPLPPVSDGAQQQDGARFGAGPVTSGALDPIGQTDGGAAATGAGAGVGGAQGQQMAAIEPVPQNPKQLYEQAYGYLLQQNYASAQTGFKEFLKSYPKDGLAPNALYWLGETHYVQKNYADAAEAFDLVTTAYASSIKAPDAQLKRGMSLAQLGKKPEACTALRDLATKFPSAPVHIKQKADTERQRNACP